MAVSGKPIILHGHIFKNAGTTFDWALQQNFGRDFVDHRDDQAMRSGRFDYLAGYLQQHPAIKALSSHHLVMPFPKHSPWRLLRIYLLRHPIERIRSVYDFEQQQNAETPGARYARQASFSDYVRWRMQGNVGATIRDFQLRYLSAAGRKLSAEHLQRVQEAMGSAFLFGIVDRYDESMVLLEQALQRWFPGIDLSYVAQNVSAGKKAGTVTERADAVIDALGDLADDVLAKNQLDLALYQHASAQLDEQIDNTAGFARLLAGFRQRCENRRKQ